MANKRTEGFTLRGSIGMPPKSQPQPESATEKPKVETPPPQPEPQLTPQKQADDKGKLVPINIKITRRQHEWLNDTAWAVRRNNSERVPPNERVFPQHLIGVAIDLLQASGVDWSQVKNVEELRKVLNL